MVFFFTFCRIQIRVRKEQLQMMWCRLFVLNLEAIFEHMWNFVVLLLKDMVVCFSSMFYFALKLCFLFRDKFLYWYVPLAQHLPQCVVGVLKKLVHTPQSVIGINHLWFFVTVFYFLFMQGYVWSGAVQQGIN